MCASSIDLPEAAEPGVGRRSNTVKFGMNTVKARPTRPG